MDTQTLTAKEYLSQARFIDQRINAKMFQLQSLRDLSTRVTVTLTGMPRNPNPCHMDDFIVKALDLENEIAADLQYLIELKAEITDTINRVESPECRMLLESRYLCFRTWEMIAIELFYDVRHVHRLHGKALREVDAIRRSAR